jgi:cytidine deaminase
MSTLPSREQLIRAAVDVRQCAYAPYSNYHVGAALLTKSGRIFTGVNVENAVYSDTVCAERVAILKAVSEGEREFQSIVVSTTNGGYPCGSCRQVLAEFGQDTEVWIVDGEGNVKDETSIKNLLPEAFSPKHLD